MRASPLVKHRAGSVRTLGLTSRRSQNRKSSSILAPAVPAEASTFGRRSACPGSLALGGPKGRRGKRYECATRAVAEGVGEEEEKAQQVPKAEAAAAVEMKR